MTANTEYSKFFEVDINAVLKERFETGQGVIQLSADMPDVALLLTIKHAASFGKTFMVVPSTVPVDDSHTSVDIAVKGIYVPLMDEATSYPSPAMLELINRTKQLTKQEMLDRIALLSGEMDANEEENKMMQDEITSLYAKIDALT
jgi:hypothetical protein